MLSLNDQYNSIYEGLSAVREIFHKDGRLSDSNQKLDEIVKLVAIHFAGTRKMIDEALYKSCLSRNTFSVSSLQMLFSEVRELELFCTGEGISVFAHAKELMFDDDENSLAFELFSTVGFSGVGADQEDQRVDFLNEAFGHFVRDNFRSNTEDAQYMTPPEVVDFMVSLAMHLCHDSKEDNLVVMDPSCGVGSFLLAAERELRSSHHKVRYVAQDKVERMVRLSVANFIFSQTQNYETHVGNSLHDGAPIEKWNGKVDLILTNPPFGAKFSQAELQASCRASVPNYAGSKNSFGSIDSELVFLDRYMTLLKEGGVCLVVIPDGVISAKGTAAFARRKLLEGAEILGIIELPSVTFAQAGTRTKTSVLVFRKLKESIKPASKVFVAEAKAIGFEVSKRKGVTIKRVIPENDLEEIQRAWKSTSSKEDELISSAFWVDSSALGGEAWTPRRLIFQAKSVSEFESTPTMKLSKLVKPPVKTKSRPYSPGTYYISVLHVIGEGLLDLSALVNYAPITPGKPITAGELIVSRINPRIPRVMVVPDLPGDILCSTEFEVLRPVDGVNPYALAFALLGPIVQGQLQSLTAGTSASHARIKPGKMYDIEIPWPIKDTGHNLEMKKHEKNLRSIFNNMWEIQERRNGCDA